MKFTFNAKRVEISEDLMNYAEKKFGKLDRYFKNDSSAHLVFSSERGRDTVEVTIYHDSMIFRSRQTTQDFYSSIDLSVEALIRQIHKTKQGSKKASQGRI